MTNEVFPASSHSSQISVPLSSAKIARVVHLGGERLLRLDTGLAKDVGGAHDRVLRVRSGFALEGQRLLEVEGDDRLLGELQHEVAQRADGDLLADAQALLLVEFGMPAVHFLLRRGDQRVEQIVGLHAESLAPRNLDVGLARDLPR